MYVLYSRSGAREREEVRYTCERTFADVLDDDGNYTYSQVVYRLVEHTLGTHTHPRVRLYLSTYARWLVREKDGMCSAAKITSSSSSGEPENETSAYAHQPSLSEFRLLYIYIYSISAVCVQVYSACTSIGIRNTRRRDNDDERRLFRYVRREKRITTIWDRARKRESQLGICMWMCVKL